MDIENFEDGPLMGFDTETTGVNEDEDRIVTASLVWHFPGKEPRVRNFLLNPGIDIPAEASAVHGISTEHAKEFGVDAREGLTAILTLMHECRDIPFVAYNGAFDFTILAREAQRHGLPVFVPPMVIDPFVIDKHIDTYRRGGRKLTDVCEIYGVKLENAHTADADALAAVLIAREIGQLRKVTGDPRELHRLQVIWKAEQAAGFESYLQRKNPSAVVAREWPIMPVGANQPAAA